MTEQKNHLNESVLTIARKNVITLSENSTVRQALDDIRMRDISDRIVYFYVVDEQERLVGVLPTRRLLTSPLDHLLSDVMIGQVMTIPQNATVLEAYEKFVNHKFLAFPIVDDQQHIVGLVDIGELTDEVLNLEEKEQMNQIFETIGFQISQVRVASPFQAFRFRFPWLLSTIGSGTICAVLASFYEVTLAKSIVLAFFLTLVLGLGESVSIQSMTLTIHTLRSVRPNMQWYMQAFRREAGTAMLLGSVCGAVVGVIVLIWRSVVFEALSIGISILFVLLTACFLGLTIPSLLHAFKFDLKIAAGPVTLAITDIFTILFYLSFAALLL